MIITDPEPGPIPAISRQVFQRGFTHPTILLRTELEGASKVALRLLLERTKAAWLLHRPSVSVQLQSQLCTVRLLIWSAAESVVAFEGVCLSKIMGGRCWVELLLSYNSSFETKRFHMQTHKKDTQRLKGSRLAIISRIDVKSCRRLLAKEVACSKCITPAGVKVWEHKQLELSFDRYWMIVAGFVCSHIDKTLAMPGSGCDWTQTSRSM